MPKNILTPVIDRVLPRLDVGVCWEWTGATNKGYGVVGAGRRGEGLLQVHRVVWEHLVGPIPDGLTLDHLCRNHCCCDPDHLEPVTVGVNVLRGYGMSRHNLERTTCNHGHPWTPDNVYRNGKYRRCKQCVRNRDARQPRHIYAPPKLPSSSL